MDDPSFFEEDLDEEEAKRSILVTDVPENLSPKDVILHFQKGSNGGGEVVNIDDHGTEHRSSVVITFEDPSIVERIMKRQHIIRGKEVTVQRYPVGTRIPKFFSGKSDHAYDKQLDAMVFQAVPIILQLIFTVSKYAKRIQDIESGFNVKIGGIEGDSKVTIRPLPRCTQRKHDDACEEYIKLYREVYDGPMISKDILLRPGNGSFYSAEDAVKQVLKMKPIAIQKMDEQDKWLIYGEEADVRSAILEVCKALRIDNPLQKTRKMKVQHTLDEEKKDAGGAYSHIPLRNDDKAQEAASLEVRGADSRSSGTSDVEQIDDMVFQSVPIILQFIFTVGKYTKRIQDIESEFNVKIDGIEGDSRVTIRPLPGCTRRKHDDASEEYIKLYREVYEGPMMAKDILLRPGNGSFYSAEDAVKKVLQMKSIAIQKMDEQDKWMFYGEETDVRSAVIEVCKALRIDNPFRKTRKMKAQHVPGEEENYAASVSVKRNQGKADDLKKISESKRQAHQETNKRKDELQRTLETVRQALQATNQRKDELQRTLGSERQAHEALNQRKDELQRTLESERQAHQETNQIKERLEISLEQERERNEELLTTQATLQRAIEDFRASTESCDWVLTRDEIVMTETLIGNGAWGSVTKGKFRGCDVAVKQIHQLILSDHNRRLFEREIGIASRCRHPCLLQFIGATNDNQSPLFVTELLDSSLREILHERALGLAEIITIALDVTKGLNYLHLCRPTPIIHRDISSANVLLWKHTACWRAKVSDFGTANFLHQSMTACPGAIDYSAPESQTSRQTPKVDVYSFGVLLCEMFVREHPDVAHREEHVARVTNEFFRRLIRRCLQRDPENRPSMAEILSKLSRCQVDLQKRLETVI